MLKTRILAAAVFAPLFLGVLIQGGVALSLTCFLLSMLLAYEFFALTLGSKQFIFKCVGYLGTALVAASFLGWIKPLSMQLLPLAMVVLGITALVAVDPLASAMQRVALTLLGIFYCGSMMPLLAVLRSFEDIGLGLAFIALVGTWAADTAAYFAGRAWGKHKLYPQVSPGKTVEGFLGAIAASIGAIFVMRACFHLPLDILDSLFLAVVTAVISALGDLYESLLKRSVGVKDSSRLIPGHGGVLDRLDGVLFALVAVYFYSIFILNLKPVVF